MKFMWKQWRIAPVIALFLTVCLHSPAYAGADEDLIRAVENNNTYRVRNLLTEGANPDVRDLQSETALMLAARNKNPELGGLLLEAGANPDLRNKYGETATMLASYYGQLDLIKRLYAKGDKIDHDGWNPLIYAASKGYKEIVEFLLSYGARINATTDNGTTALMMAARGNHYDTVELLLQRGADVSVRNEADGTALAWARKQGHADIVQLLSRNETSH
ncbi:MAG: ankyrin repeat domain-containing protein [Burkholderiales bacterium]|nr:ankyrin repeat domain-containing protein [Burkholderiales bacterium]